MQIRLFETVSKVSKREKFQMVCKVILISLSLMQTSLKILPIMKLIFLCPLEIATNGKVQNMAEGKVDNYKMEIKWRNVLIFLILHILAVYGFCLPKTRSTVIIGWIFGLLAGVGTTVGAHRLFTHRTFTPNLKMKVLMMLLQSMALQEPVLKWARDHRVHHKFTDTNADPYNSRRGFFFCHIGWLMCKKHPDVITQGKKVDMSDLERDPVLLFQQR